MKSFQELKASLSKTVSLAKFCESEALRISDALRDENKKLREELLYVRVTDSRQRKPSTTIDSPQERTALGLWSEGQASQTSKPCSSRSSADFADPQSPPGLPPSLVVAVPAPAVKQSPKKSSDQELWTSESSVEASPQAASTQSSVDDVTSSLAVPEPRRISRSNSAPPPNQSEEVLVDAGSQLYGMRLHSVESLHPDGYISEGIINNLTAMADVSDESSDEDVEPLAPIVADQTASLTRPPRHLRRMHSQSAPGSRRVSLCTPAGDFHARLGVLRSRPDPNRRGSNQSEHFEGHALPITQLRNSIRSQLRCGTAPGTNLSAGRYSMQLQASLDRASRAGSSDSIQGSQVGHRISVAMNMQPFIGSRTTSGRPKHARGRSNSHVSMQSFHSEEESVRASLSSSQMPGLANFTAEEADTGLELWPKWKDLAAKLHTKVMLDVGRGGGLGTRSNHSQLDQVGCESMRRQSSRSMSMIRMTSVTSEKWLKGIIIHPNSFFKIVWDILCMAFMGYDIIIIPLLSFEIPPTVFTTIMVWLTLLYWTFDLPCTFLTGFTLNGAIELNRKKIAMRYFKTWFSFDLCVLAIDWVLTIFEELGKQGDFNSANYVKMGRTARIVRLLRLLRLLRLVKVQGKLSEVLQAIQSEYIRIILGIGKLIVFILIFNHVIACGWYLLGSHVEDNNTWVGALDMKERSIGYRYFSSLHWSLTQFTPASMEIVPKNTGERVYNVVVLIFAMVTFSSFISSITNATTLLRTLDSADTDRRSYLFKYLRQHEVPMGLASEVWSWVLSAKTSASRHHVHEREVTVLQLLPKSLQTQLRDQVFGPIVTKHPLFREIACSSSTSASKLYAGCMTEIAVGMGKELFMNGDVAEHMYFLVAGEMRFFAKPQDPLAGTRDFSTAALVKKKLSEDQNVSAPITEGQNEGSCSLSSEEVRNSASESPKGSSKRVSVVSCSSQHEKFDIHGSSSQDTRLSKRKSTVSKAEQRRPSRDAHSLRWQAATDGEGEILWAGDWFCEQVLWVKWKHRGTLDARTHSDLFGLSCKSFIEFVEREDLLQVCLYARHFLKYMAMCEEQLNDAWMDLDVIRRLAEDAYYEYAGFEQQCLSAFTEEVPRTSNASSDLMSSNSSHLGSTSIDIPGTVHSTQPLDVVPA